MPPPADPQWFYSSLAQVTAALIGFLGAFLLIRLSAYIGEWRTAQVTLERLQRDWWSADYARQQAEAKFSGVALTQAIHREMDAWHAAREVRDLSEPAANLQCG